jgi:hypothetical protein
MAKSLYLIAVCILLSLPLTAQTKPSAEGQGILVWVGFSVSTFNPDYGCPSNSPFTCWNSQLIGISPYVHTNPLLFGRIGAEGEARFMHWHGPVDLTMDSYMGGPRVRLWNHKKLAFSGKFLLGTARITVDPAVDGNYFAFAPGGAVDYRLSRHFSTRLDYEYQMWPSFKGTQTGPGHSGGLTPNGFSVGISYALK